jgi:hypothetical protein
MSDTRREMSPARKALQMKAERTKKIVIFNLSLTAVLSLIAVGIWGYKHGWFASTARETAAVQPSDRPAWSRPSGSEEPDLPAEPVEPEAPRPVRKWAVVCGVTNDTRARMSEFVRSTLGGMGSRNTIDVMVLSPDQFTSITGGLVPVTAETATAAADLVAHTSEQPSVSAMVALQKAGDEQVDGVYLMLTTAGAKNLGPDPAAAIRKLNHGRKLVINCIWFMTDHEVQGENPLKTLADASGGGFFVKRAPHR